MLSNPKKKVEFTPNEIILEQEIFYSGSQWNESKVLSTRDDKQPP